jgi:hypothetical protein
MTEIMAIEKIAEEHAKLEGFLTITRVPYKKVKNYGDLDILAYSPEDGFLMLIDVKARGKVERYTNANTEKGREYIERRISGLMTYWPKFVSGNTNRWKFKKLDKIRLIVDGPFDAKHQFQEDLTKKFEVPVELLPIHELFEQIILRVNVDMRVRRKRYPDTALEFIRWLIKCVNAKKLSLKDLENQLFKQDASKAPYQLPL